MVPLTRQAHALVSQTVPAGGIAVDATAGNGHDTLFLAQLVGPEGHVFAIDIQSAAVSATRERIASAGLMNTVVLQANHAELLRIIPLPFHQQIDVMLFNLGYLPGSDKEVVTKSKSTLEALMAATALLKPGGLLSVIAYPGHAGGDLERDAVRDWLEHQTRLQIVHRSESARPESPQWFAAVLRDAR
ncbi:class I SAM-dependent methyltransferase [Planctomicrobium sp. SH664]|uniref:tRNA (mnm(5)s(2)U34)-methyltransferase n=1 Tax=Planctomicrobium sp. SH664 TaxID=3448125 RepID=UPI003F5BFE92